MQIRRFRAPDMRQAIRKVRDAVGPDAVILSNQRLPTGEIEIVAALDYDGSLPSGMSSKRSPSPSKQDGPSADYLERIERAKQQVPPVESIKTPSSTENRPTTQFEMPPISEDKTDPKVEEALSIRNAENAKQFRDMKLELENVRAMLELRQQASPRSDSKVNEIEIRAGDKLKSLGLSDFVVSRLIDDIDLQGREDDWNRLLAHLADYIPVRSGSSELRGCIAFMGPTGVGKTTSIGKIAAQHVLKYGSDGVVLITLKK